MEQIMPLIAGNVADAFAAGSGIVVALLCALSALVVIKFIFD